MPRFPEICSDMGAIVVPKSGLMIFFVNQNIEGVKFESQTLLKVLKLFVIYII